MAIAVVGSPFPINFGSPGGGTSGSINTSGADALILDVCYYSALSGFPVVSDSKGNTYIGLTAREFELANRFFYCLGATVGSGHTFTVARGNSADIYPSMIVYPLSSVDSFDQQTGGTSTPNNVTSFAPGSITPSGNGAIVLTGEVMNIVELPTCNIGTQSDQLTTFGQCVGCSGSYTIQTTAAAFNPTWSWATSNKAAGNTVSFLPAAGPTATPKTYFFLVG